MRLSLRTKFYIHILPLAVILPVLLYSLAAPYSQMREIFLQFQEEADRASSAQELSEYISLELVELQQFILEEQIIDTDSTHEHRIHNYHDGKLAYEDQATGVLQYLGHPTDIDESHTTNEYDLIATITEDYKTLKQLALQTIELAHEGNREAAFTELATKIQRLVDESIEPNIETVIDLEVETVEENLPVVASIINRFGVIPIPRIHDRIVQSSDNLNDALDAEELVEQIAHLQVLVFGLLHSTSSTRDTSLNAYYIKQEEVQNALSDLQSGEERENEENDGKTQTLAAIKNDLTKLLTLHERVITLIQEDKKDDATAILSNDVDEFMTSSLLPEIEELARKEEAQRDAAISSLERTIDLIVHTSWFVCLAIFLIGVGSMWRLSQIVIRPIVLLHNAMNDIAKGGSFTPLPIPNTKDEIADLASAFNVMIQKIRDAHAGLEQTIQERTKELEDVKGALQEKVAERTKELEDAKQNLEKTVATRTEELKQKVKDLEELNTFMTGRELKMTELKQKIEELEHKENPDS